MYAPCLLYTSTDAADGMIESALVPVPKMQGRINEKYGAKLSGRLYLKLDSHLPIAGSIKGRGGIYEVLKHTEDLALEHGLITLKDSYEEMCIRDRIIQYPQYWGTKSREQRFSRLFGVSCPAG